jgi:sarcosine oxidase subunit gamma
MVAATAFARRSWLHHELAAAGARFGQVGDAAVPLAYGGDEQAQAERLGLAELSPLPRLGFKGRSTLAQLNAKGVALVEEPNRAVLQPDGGLAAVLARTEVLLLAPLSGEGAGLAALAEGWALALADGHYPVPRQDSHYWFAVTGCHAAALFAKLCGVDLRPQAFADLAIAQTSVARSSAIVIRRDLGALPAFFLLGDSASAGYMWACLLDAMAEFDGGPVGLEALRAWA